MIFALLTLLAALSLAAVAGWFSIIGIMSIYAGAGAHALVMGIVLETGKLVTTSWLYRNWDYSGWKLKIPLIFFTLTLMLATSIGVFGFLAKSHLEQGTGTIDNSAKVERLEQQIAREKSTIADNEKVIAQLDATINSYIGKDRTDRSVTIRRSQVPQRKQLRDDIDTSQKRIDQYSDEKFKLQSEVRKLQLDVGPIRYISELIYGTDGNTDKNIESAVRMFTLIIVSTLDPLAVILLIAANHTILRNQNEKKQKTKRKYDSNPGSKNECELVTETKVDASTSSEIVGSVNAEDHSISKESPIILEISDTGIQTSTDKKVLSNCCETIGEGITCSEEITEVHVEMKNEIGLSANQVTWPVIPKQINEEKTSTLGEFCAATVSAPLPIIRSPNPTRISENNRTIAHDSAETVETPISDTKIMAIPINHLRNLSDFAPHFIPRKLNEKEKSREMDASLPQGWNSSEEVKIFEQNTGKTEKIHQEGSEIDAVFAGSSAGHNFEATPTSKDKYPKALGWLTEFKRI